MARALACTSIIACHFVARLPLCIALAVAVPAAARAQSFNVDFGRSFTRPADGYAAAGQPGYWNGIEGEDMPRTTYPLRGLDGADTTVTLYNIGGTELAIVDDASVTGDDAALLLNDALITYTSSLETCLFIEGLQPGTYEVITYAWMPSAPAVMSRVRHDPDPTTADVGGAWPGSHQEGITYARHVITVGPDGFLGSHSGIVPGMPETAGAALNGIQLRQIDCSVCPDAGPPEVDAGPPAPPPPSGGCAIAPGASPSAALLAAAAITLAARRRRGASSRRAAP
jgi:hypothetical protein